MISRTKIMGIIYVSTGMSKSDREEIKAAIRFYEKRGACWLDVITFLSLRATGRLDQFMRPWSAYWRAKN